MAAPSWTTRGASNIWGGGICADELSLANTATKATSLDTVIIDEDGAKLASAVEVLEPGDRIDPLYDTGEGAAITRLAKSSDPDTGPEFTLGLIAPVAMNEGNTALGFFEGCYKYE